MKYAIAYDIGDRKRESGINEDSVAVNVVEDGHREGYSIGASTGESAAVDDTETDSAGGAEAGAASGDTESTTRKVISKVTGGKPTSHSETDVEHDPEAFTETDHPPMNRSAGVFALADGAGGHDAGDAASYIATTVVVEELSNVLHRAVRSRPDRFDVEIEEGIVPEPPTETEIKEAIETAVNQAHEDVIRYASTAEQEAYTTVVAGVYVGDQFHCGWVGDSRAYVVNTARERIELLTKDHAIVEEWHDEGRIDDVEAHVHPSGNEITRAVGGSEYEDPKSAEVEVDTNTVELYEEDVVLLTSDGLIDAQTDAPLLHDRYTNASGDRQEEVGEEVLEEVVTDDEIRDVVLGAESLDAAATEFVDLSNDRGGKDNISVILFSDSTLPGTPAPEETTMSVRSYDPDGEVEEWQTVIRDE